MIAPNMNLTKKTILLVDGDGDYRGGLRAQLEEYGFHVIAADGARSADELLRADRPDLVITELMLEEMDAGFTLSYHIKKKDPTIPIIIVTAVTGRTGLEFDTATAEERSWVKADAMLPKPIRLEQLLREIERLVKE